MRQDVVSGVTLSYPDAVTFAFNPVLLIATPSTTMEVSLTDGDATYTQTYEANVDGNVYADVQQIIQLFFADETFSLDYDSDTQSTGMGKTITFDVSVSNSGGSASFSKTSFVVWGAMNPNGQDVFNGYRKQKYFVGYPFTFGFYISTSSTILISQGASPSTSKVISTQGMWEMNGSLLPNNATFSNIYDYAGTLQQGYFDSTFDLTFYLNQNVAQTLLTRIDIEQCADDDTIYLRWLSRHGFYCYWLFNYKQRQRITAYTQDFSREELQEFDLDFGYNRGAGRRASYERHGAIPLAVPLADVEQYKYLLDIISSPVVDMYIGKDTNNDPRWQNVAVAAGTYTQTDKEMQDFVINLILPTTPTQHL